ncbi:hypothetical protein JTB14_003199 [Gonioctena quinquepunctata]|nr:hypothetical protein JTB14_003199 [Gonioctena quinquepunctata]
MSTKYTDEMITIQMRKGEIKKPENILEYNKYKASIDIYDQMKSNNLTLRKRLKWYIQLYVELLTGTALVNAFFAHQDIANEPMSITTFKEKVIAGLLQVPDVEKSSQENTHQLTDLGRSGRRRCVKCYAQKTNKLGRHRTPRKTTQSTLKCEARGKHFCPQYFFLILVK